VGAGEHGLQWPDGGGLDSLQELYVSDYYNQRVQVFDSAGSYSTTIGVTEQSSVTMPISMALSHCH
jgi:hypothetical protein